MDSRFDARRIRGQTLKQRHFMFDAYHKQRRMAILQESVYVAVHLTIEMATVRTRLQEHATNHQPPGGRLVLVSTSQAERDSLWRQAFRSDAGREFQGGR